MVTSRDLRQGRPTPLRRPVLQTEGLGSAAMGEQSDFKFQAAAEGIKNKQKCHGEARGFKSCQGRNKGASAA